MKTEPQIDQPSLQPTRWRRAILLALSLTTILVAPRPAAAQFQFTVLHSFNGADGFGPMAGVVQGADGALYGTTSRGGSANLGTVFRLDPATWGVTTLHEFSGPDGSVLYSGLAFGRDGLLYGSTYSGGAGDLGTLFRVGFDGQGFASLHSFSGTDGAGPEDLQLTHAADGAIYGATSAGGPDGGGTLFRLDLTMPSLTTFYSFSAPAGVDAGLVAGRNGAWYGTTYSGGANGAGSVFQVDPATGILTALHDFTSIGGMNPVPGALIQGGDGNLYGTTQLGGGYGTVYQLNPSTLAFTTLHTFSGLNDGRMPLGGVAEGGDGYLYGTTVLGGQGYGTVFRVNPTTLAYNIVVWFGGSNGRSPSGNLLRSQDGALYGVTRVGGAFNSGTIFRISPADATPPIITRITASPSVLQPVNNKMVPVTLAVIATDAMDPAPKSKIIGVTSNQSITGDWAITGDLTLTLRAKHSGRIERIYTITVQCTDASGNSATGTVSVTVPK